MCFAYSCGIIENQTSNLKHKKVAIIGLVDGLSALLASVYKKAKKICVRKKLRKIKLY